MPIEAVNRPILIHRRFARPEDVFMLDIQVVLISMLLLGVHVLVPSFLKLSRRL